MWGALTRAERVLFIVAEGGPAPVVRAEDAGCSCYQHVLWPSVAGAGERVAAR